MITYKNETDILQVVYDYRMRPYRVSPGETVTYDEEPEASVVTNNLGDLDDVDLSSIAAGAVLYRNAAEKWVNLPKGALGRVLTLGASIPDWEGVKKLGAGSNFTQIAVDGVVTLEGDARVKHHVRVCAPSWAKGGSAPSEAFIGTVPVLCFDKALDDEAYYTLLVPWRIHAGTTVQAMVDWTYTGAQDNGTVCWKLDYIDLDEGDTVGASATTVSKTTAGNHVTGKLVRTALVPDLSGLVAHHNLGLRLWRDESEDTLNTDACIIEVHFAFTKNKLGEPV